MNSARSDSLTNRRGLRRRLLLVCSALLLQGCVTVYQPLVSLQRPVVVDPQSANLEGVKLQVRCIAAEEDERSDAQVLCRKTTTLFSNQGALVSSEVPVDGRATSSRESEKPDLVVEIRSRMIHQESNRLLAGLSGATLTIVPFSREESFAQDITVRDAEGALLASDSLQARFVHHVGVAFWFVNWILDFMVRDTPDELLGDDYKVDFSRDLYGQLSQLVFNAHVRSRVLRGFAAAPQEPK